MTGDPGFTVTLKDVYLAVRDLDDKLDTRIRSLQVQVSAQWVVIGIVIVGLGAMLARSLS